MFDYYFAIIFFAVFIMIIMKLMIKGDQFLEEKEAKRLKIVSTLVIIASISEWLGVFLNGKPLWTYPIHVSVKILELSLAPFIPVLCATIIGQIKKEKLFLGVFGIHAALEALSGVFGFIFYVDKNNIYNHGTLYFIYVIAFSVGIAIFIWIVLDESRHQYGLRKALMLFLPFFALCGLALQYLSDNTKVIWLCISIDVLIMYILYLETKQNLDALTHLFNRRYYESKISRMTENAVVFYFDVDNFKSVNDTYGHEYGDVALVTAAESIQSIFGKNGHCYRIGGDEFCAIEYIKTKEAKKYVDDFKNVVKKRRNKDSRLPYVSVGYSYFEKDKSNISDVINKADAMMYKNKKKDKESRHN